MASIVRERSLAPIDVVQLKYSVIEPVEAPESDLYPPLDRRMKEALRRIIPDAVVFAYSPLLRGQVFEKHAQEEWPSEYDSKQNREKVRRIQRKADELGVPPSAYVLKQIADEGIVPITATGKVGRLASNFRLLVSQGD